MKEQKLSTLQANFDKILAWFASDDYDIDQALVKYQEAIDLSQQIKNKITLSENKLTKIMNKMQESDK